MLDTQEPANSTIVSYSSPATTWAYWKAALVSAHLLAQSLLASLGRLGLHFLGSKLPPMDPVSHGKLFSCCVEFSYL